MISGIAGAIIWTEDVARLVNFYCNVLDLPIHSTRPEFITFSFGEVRLSLGRHSLVHGSSEDPHRIMINFATTDIHSTYKHLRERGVLFLRKPEQENAGHWIATFSDPDGNILQLLQQPIQSERQTKV